MNRIEQIIGRAVRNFSHKDLDFEERNVEIFMHGTILGKENIEEAADLYVYRVAEFKAIQIGNITRLLKESAVDCIINQDQQSFTQKIMNDPNITEQIPGATPERARPNTVYQQAHVVDGVPEPQSKGVVTSKVLNAAAQLPPTVAQNLSESDSIRNIIGQKIARDDMLPGARPDIQNMRRFFRDADWSKAVDMIRKGAAPAAAAAALGYSLDAMAADRPEARR